jgi:hypothetical protein
VVDLSTFFSGNGGSKFRKKFGIFEEPAVYADLTVETEKIFPIEPSIVASACTK